MSAHQNYLSIESSSIRNLGLQGCELSSSAYSPAAYGRGTTKMPPSLSDNNGAFKLWLAAKSVKRLSGLLLVAAVTALGLTLPAHSQAMVRVNSPAFDDNSRIVEMMNKGFDDTIIVAKIKSANWAFNLNDDEILALRNRGVSAPVVAAMVNSSVLSTARVSIDMHPVKLDSMGQAKTGGRLLNNLTGDLTPLTVNAFLEGPAAKTDASPMPDILVSLPEGESIASYILVQMNTKNDRRELQVASGSGISNSRTGIGGRSIRPSHVIERGDNTYQIQSEKPLKAGQYMVYVIGSSDERKDIYGKGYPFSVGR